MCRDVSVPPCPPLPLHLRSHPKPIPIKMVQCTLWSSQLVPTKITCSWDVTQCSLVDSYQRLGGIYLLHLHGSAVWSKPDGVTSVKKPVLITNGSLLRCRVDKSHALFSDSFSVSNWGGFFSVALRPNAGYGLLILQVSRSHTTTHNSR